MYDVNKDCIFLKIFSLLCLIYYLFIYLIFNSIIISLFHCIVSCFDIHYFLLYSMHDYIFFLLISFILFYYILVKLPKLQLINFYSTQFYFGLIILISMNLVY